MRLKSFLRVILVCAVVLGTVSGAFGWWGRVRADVLNVRAKPSIKSRIVGKLEEGDYVEGGKRQRDNTGRTWYYVHFQDGITEIEGWVAAEYIDRDR
ncbi:MAG: SH3 domain-containing protein [Synergistaceae bacterium]|nr:SH3 domain-containing protein [Synergistaceae bacterium]